jgi:hypothetical protein
VFGGGQYDTRLSIFSTNEIERKNYAYVAWCFFSGFAGSHFSGVGFSSCSEATTDQ